MREILVFNRTLHRELWYWLAAHPGLEKTSWEGWKRLCKTDSMEFANSGFCFACLTARFYSSVSNAPAIDCTLCPIDWNTDKGCLDKNSYYDIWLDLKFYYNSLLEYGTASKYKNKERLEKEISRYAKSIAELPIRKSEGVELIVI